MHNLDQKLQRIIKLSACEALKKNLCKRVLPQAGMFFRKLSKLVDRKRMPPDLHTLPTCFL